MLFNSPFFLLIFIPLFFLSYFSVGKLSLRNIVIVLFSIFFFAWGDPVFIWYVISGTWVDYMIIKHALCCSNKSERVKKFWLAVAILINVAALGFFKYANFFIDQLFMMGLPKPSWYGVALPLGISFIAFHKISFVTDLYKNRLAPPKNFINALLYILFFPQLIAGPIIRYHEIGQQINWRTHSCGDFLGGFFRFSRGLAKKAMFADPAGGIADAVFALSPKSIPIPYAWIGVIAYAIQIYFDFSGYSDMAIGLGRMAGFRFPENFNQPYISKSVTEFWRRWHITLSNWMRLYLYIPLGGNQVKPWRMYLNLWIVFLISGFWHGAAWTFVLWGAYYGLFLTIEKFCQRNNLNIPMPGPIKQFLTFVIILNSWALFRAPTIHYAKILIGRMYGLLPQVQPTPQPFALIFPSHEMTMIIIGLFIAMIPLPDMVRRLSDVRDKLWLDIVRWVSSIVMFTVSLASIMASGSSSFLYFRF